MKITKLGKGLLTSSLALSLFLGAQSLVFADEETQSIVDETTEADVILPIAEIEQVSLQELPIYYGSDLGTFDSVESVMPKIRDAMANFESTVTFTYTGDFNTFGKDFSAAREIMFVQPGNDYIYGTIKSTSYSAKIFSSYSTITMSFTYRGTLEEEAYVTKRVKEIAAELTTEGMSDFEKVLAVNDYIVTNTVYSKNPSTTPHHAYALLNEGKAVCQAYALVAYRLLMEMGIETRYVTGDAGEPHAWNSVKIDGVWYHLDTTWNDPSFNSLDLGGGVSYKYFLVTTDYLKQDHTWEEQYYPEATDNRYSAYHDMMMGDIQGDEIYFASRANNYNLYKLNIKTGNKELVLGRPVYYIAAHNEYVYFSDLQNNKYLTSYNLITKTREMLVNEAVTRLHVKNGTLHYMVGSKAYTYELPLSAIEQAIRDVELQLLSLSEFSTMEDLDAAQAAYDALTPEQKLEIKNIAKIQQLKDIYPVNLAAAEVVANEVDNFTEQSKRVELLQLIAKFDALKPSQQALVSNKDKVYNFKGIIAAQDNQIKLVVDGISKLSTKSKTYLADIVKIRTAYDALDSQLKPEVSNFTTFENLETDVKAAQVAFDLINQLDGTSVDAIVAARTAYKETSKATQKYVTNLKALTTYESALKNVIAAVNAINAIDPTSTKFVTQVAAARKAYDKAGTQQNLVTNGADFLVIEEQAKVFDAIAKLKTSSAKYIAEVAAAKVAYDKLTVKALVTNADKLISAVDTIKPSEIVIAQIAALDGSSVQAVLDAREALNALDKVSKKHITNAKQLAALEKSLKNEIAAVKAIDAIDPSHKKFISQVKAAKKAYEKAGVKKELVTNAEKLLTIEPQVVVLEQITKLNPSSAKYIAEVTAAKKAYDALTENTLVTNAEKLATAVEAIKPAQIVVEKVDTLDGTSALAVIDVRKAYEELDKTTKKYVTNVKELTEFEKTLKDVFSAMKAIDAIDESSSKFVSQVKAAKKAYDKAGSQQALVPNAAEFLIIEPQAVVYEQISKLKASSPNYIEEVTAAKEAYDKLAVKALVTNNATLTTAVEVIKPAQEVVAQIEALKGDSIEEITEARTAFNALNKSVQKYVTNNNALKALEKKVAAPLKVVNLINEVKTIDVSTKSFVSKTATLKKQYTALTDENKALVTNVADYTYLVALYEIKNAQATKKWDAVTVTTFSDLSIEGVTTDNLSKVVTGFTALKAGTGTATVSEITTNVAAFIAE